MKRRQGLTRHSFLKRVNEGFTRRSFMVRVTGGGIVISGGAVPLLAGDALAFNQSGCTDSDPTPARPTRDPGGQGVRCATTTAPGQNPYRGCSDNDPTDDYQRGRTCAAPGAGGTTAPGQNPYRGCSDSDPTDDFQRGRTCTPRGGGGSSAPSGCSDSDPTDPGGRGRNCGGRTPPPQSGCSDSDPTDPGGRGRHCGGGSGSGGSRGGGATASRYPTGRRERRYEVCWIDRNTNRYADCNMQIYSDWAIIYSDGSVEFDTADSRRRRAEMEARGYRVGTWRWILDDWDPAWTRN